MAKASCEQERTLWRSIVDLMDGWLVPASFGLLTVLVLAQALTAVPTVRRFVDGTAGRFVAVRASASDATASVSLYLSPPVPQPNIRVFIGQRYVGNFSTPALTVQLHAGDKVRLVCTRTTAATTVTIDDNDAHLLFPAPGWTEVLSSADRELVFPPAKFVS